MCVLTEVCTHSEAALGLCFYSNVSERQKCTETGSAWPHWRLERRNALTRDRESRLISPPLFFFFFFWWGVFLPCLACSSLVVRNLSGGVCGKMHTPKHIHAHGLFKSGQPPWAAPLGHACGGYSNTMLDSGGVL